MSTVEPAPRGVSGVVLPTEQGRQRAVCLLCGWHQTAQVYEQAERDLCAHLAARHRIHVDCRKRPDGSVERFGDDKVPPLSP